MVSHCRRWERNGAEDNNAPQNTENNDKLDSISAAVKNLKGSNSALAWKWLKKCIGKEKAFSNESVKPIAHENGRLLLDVDEIKDCWARYFQALVADPTGHSRDKTYWETSVEFEPSKNLSHEI